MTESQPEEFATLEKLVEALSALATDANWPEGDQGRFLGVLAGDLVEFATAILNEARAERWTAALSLGRSVHERREYLLAAAIDPGFWDTYKSRMQKRIDSGYRGRSRLLSENARGVIAGWDAKRRDTPRLLDLGLRVQATSSEMLHHGIGVSWVASWDSQHRALSLTNAEMIVRGAGAGLLLSLFILGENNNEAYRRTWSIVYDSPEDEVSAMQEAQGEGS